MFAKATGFRVRGAALTWRRNTAGALVAAPVSYAADARGPMPKKTDPNRYGLLIAAGFNA